MTDSRTPGVIDQLKERARAMFERGDDLATIGKAVGRHKGTISKWARAAGWKRDATVAPPKTAAATEAAQRKWAVRRSREADLAGDAATAARETALLMLAGHKVQEIDDDGEPVVYDVPPDPKAAKEAALAFAIFVDKAQLLSGGSTDRQEITGQADQALAKVRDRMAELQARKGTANLRAVK